MNLLKFSGYRLELRANKPVADEEDDSSRFPVFDGSRIGKLTFPAIDLLVLNDGQGHDRTRVQKVIAGHGQRWQRDISISWPKGLREIVNEGVRKAFAMLPRDKQTEMYFPLRGMRLIPMDEELEKHWDSIIKPEKKRLSVHMDEARHFEAPAGDIPDVPAFDEDAGRLPNPALSNFGL